MIATVTVNWSYVIGALLIAVGGLGSLPAVLKWLAVPKTGVTPVERKVSTPTKVADPLPRSADEVAPVDAVEWVLDICKAMGDAKADTVVSALKAGVSRDAAKSIRISELEKTTDVV